MPNLYLVHVVFDVVVLANTQKEAEAFAEGCALISHAHDCDEDPSFYSVTQVKGKQDLPGPTLSGSHCPCLLTEDDQDLSVKEWLEHLELQQEEQELQQVSPSNPNQLRLL